MDASTPIIANLRTLFAKHGQAQFGEHVTQLEHALQCASLAQASDAAPSLILAALLHDIGHFLHQDARAALQAGIDDQHEAIGAEAPARWFGPEVWQPVALHVDRVLEGNTASNTAIGKLSKTASEMANVGSSEIALVNRAAIGGER